MAHEAKLIHLNVKMNYQLKTQAFKCERNPVDKPIYLLTNAKKSSHKGFIHIWKLSNAHHGLSLFVTIQRKEMECSRVRKT